MALALYHHGSSACAAKVRFALAEKRLPWVGHYVDILAGEQFKPEFLAINPEAVVPVLVHHTWAVELPCVGRLAHAQRCPRLKAWAIESQ